MVIKHITVLTLGEPPAPLDFARPVANHLPREGSSSAALGFLRVTPSTSVTASRAEGVCGVTVWIWVPLVPSVVSFGSTSNLYATRVMGFPRETIPLVSETMQNATLILNRLQRQALTFSGNPTLGLRASIRQPRPGPEPSTDPPRDHRPLTPSPSLRLFGLIEGAPWSDRLQLAGDSSSSLTEDEVGTAGRGPLHLPHNGSMCVLLSV